MVAQNLYKVSCQLARHISGISVYHSVSKYIRANSPEDADYQFHKQYECKVTTTVDLIEPDLNTYKSHTFNPVDSAY